MIVYLLLAIPEIIENFEKFITSFGEKIENEILASLGLKTPKKINHVHFGISWFIPIPIYIFVCKS